VSSGGDGGNASVSSLGCSTGGNAAAYGQVVAGNGGAGSGAGNAPGIAGVATIGTAKVVAYTVGAGDSAYAQLKAYGGNGGSGVLDANGIVGAATTLTNAVYGFSNNGTLKLQQSAIGGAGGGSTGGAAAQGGNATSTLSFTDGIQSQSDRVFYSAVLVGYVHAQAGSGGSGYSGSNGANGGAAVATLVQQGAGQVGALTTAHGANAMGGGGGNGNVGGAGAGGGAQASDSSTTTTTGTSTVYAYVTAKGGLGGGGTGGAGAAGGNATQATATATGAAQTGGHAYAKVREIGGAGGNASGSGNTGGTGGTVTGASADAIGYSGHAVVAQYGGAGGSGDTSANGGAGANSLLNDAVGGATNGGNPAQPPAPGTTDGGYLTLKQTAHGGAGGGGNGAGAGGAAGYGYSYLDFADVGATIRHANVFHAGTLTATVGGYGGVGGSSASGVAAAGAAGKAVLTLAGYGQVTGTARAMGGVGSDSANGGKAVADATVTSQGVHSVGETATATAIATGGAINGTMGTANADASAATADGQQATATATASGTQATDHSSAQTQDTASTLVLGVSAATSTNTPFVSYDESMTSSATIGGAGEPLDSVGGTGFSWASGLPTGTAVTSIIDPTLGPEQPNPYANIDDAFAASQDPNATVLGYGVVGADTNATASAVTVTASQTYDLTAAALGGELELGLASGAEYGPVDNVTLTVTVGGTQVLDASYANVSDMVTFFTDDVQPLGSFGGTTIPAGGLPVTIALSVATPGPGALSGFEGNFVLGSSGAAPCFLAGTCILTACGEVAVEDLRVDDLVHTVLGEANAPIIWIGRREVDCARHATPRQVRPVRVAAGAFGPGRPHRDLLLSPDHAVYVNEVLIPVKHLINGSTIVQVPMQRVTYYHVELPAHDVLLAEGLPAESFLDLRDGSNYANRLGPTRLHPDYSVGMWEAFGCARLIVTDPELEAARALVEMFARMQRAA
jgi:hypothetical protein